MVPHHWVMAKALLSKILVDQVKTSLAKVLISLIELVDLLLLRVKVGLLQ